MSVQLSRLPTLPARQRSTPADRAEVWLADFDDYMLNERGLSIATRRGRCSVIGRFLSKVVTAGIPFTGLTFRDVDLDEGGVYIGKSASNGKPLHTTFTKGMTYSARASGRSFANFRAGHNN